MKNRHPGLHEDEETGRMVWGRHLQISISQDLAHGTHHLQFNKRKTIQSENMERHENPFTVKDLQQTKEYVNYRETQKTTKEHSCTPVKLSERKRQCWVPKADE